MKKGGFTSVHSLEDFRACGDSQHKVVLFSLCASSPVHRQNQKLAVDGLTCCRMHAGKLLTVSWTQCGMLQKICKDCCRENVLPCPVYNVCRPTINTQISFDQGPISPSSFWPPKFTLEVSTRKYETGGHFIEPFQRPNLSKHGKPCSIKIRSSPNA